MKAPRTQMELNLFAPAASKEAGDSLMKKSVLITLLFTMLFSSPRIFAEEAAPPAASENLESRIQERVAYLKQLREQNPEAFQKFVQQRKADLKERVQHYQQQNPQGFESFKQNIAQQRRQEFQELKRNNPQEFQHRMEGRLNQMAQWKEKNPERFQQFLQTHPRMAKQIQQNPKFNRGPNLGNRHEEGRQNLSQNRLPEKFKNREEGSGQSRLNQNQNDPSKHPQFQPMPENFQQKREAFQERREPFRGKRPEFQDQKPGFRQNRENFNPSQNFGEQFQNSNPPEGGAAGFGPANPRQQDQERGPHRRRRNQGFWQKGSNGGNQRPGPSGEGSDRDRNY